MPAYTLPLLATKWQRPRLGPQYVPRQALLARLDDALSVPLTLVSAPAGFGKSVTVAEWAARSHGPTADAADAAATSPPFLAAWLTLEPRDNDPVRFWTYVTASLATLPLGTMQPALMQLLDATRSQDAPPLEAVVEQLVALFDNAPVQEVESGHIVLILDDYHHMRAQRIHDTLNYFIAHLPPQLHLLIASRADPPLPLNRWRVNGRLLELRAADLCFSTEEAGAMLSRRTKLVLPPEDVATLVAFTDGWPAGLQLLAVSLQGRSRREVNTLIRSFPGDSRFVLAYLLEEVLQNQPQPVRAFLLRTSILQRFNASLCDELMAVADADPHVEDVVDLAPGTGDAPLTSRAIIAYLERQSLFVVPLGDAPGWYRYYHLFADALHAELDRSAPTLGVELHRRASRWFVAHGCVREAIEHALLADDKEFAADLLVDAGHDLLVGGEFSELFDWISALPVQTIACRPRLAILRGWLHVLRGSLQSVQGVVDQLSPAMGLSLLGAEDARSALAGELAALHTMLASYRWDIRATFALGAKAERMLPADDNFSLAAVHHATGLAYHLSGHGQEAIAHFMRAQSYANALGSTYMVLFPLFRLGHTYLELGALRDAEAVYRRGLQLAADHGGSQWAANADGYMGIAAVLSERNDLLGAEHFINRAMVLAPIRSVSVLASASAIHAHVRQSLGRRNGEGSPLAAAIQAATAYDSPHLVQWLQACQARLDLAAGDLNAVHQWAQSQSTGWDEEGYFPEFEELTRARYYLADHRPRAALALLNLWQARAEERSRMRSLIEIAVLQAEAQWLLNQRTEAQSALCRALNLAEPEGIQRVFLDEGDRLAPILETLAPIDHCAARLLEVVRGGRVAAAGAALREPLDHLTPRELEILRAIARGASNQQVADAFVLTVGTVKGHVNHILSKLGAASRTEAVARAREIGLI